jgi:hypothetical protein
LLVAVLLVAGCAARSTPRPADRAVGLLPEAPQILAALAERRAALHSVRAMARLSYTAPDESRRAKQLVVVERPDRLRFEILSPFGALFVLTAADGSLAAWARDESTVYRGTASAENLQRYAQVDLPVATAVDLLLGTPPLGDDPGSVVSVDGDAIELWQERGALVQVAWFSPPSSRCATSSAIRTVASCCARPSTSTPPSTASGWPPSSASSFRPPAGASTSPSARPR